MKRSVISLFCGFAIAAMSAGAAIASPPSLTGTWTVQQTGLNGTTTSTITITQSGSDFVGSNAKNGSGFTGTFVSDTQINGKWHGQGGAGWLTVYASANGHSFNGTWGYNGRPANGSFVGNKVLPPSPITAAGTWHVTGAGGPTAFLGTMTCKQSGAAVVCHVGAGHLQRAVQSHRQGPSDLERRTASRVGSRSGSTATTTASTASGATAPTRHRRSVASSANVRSAVKRRARVRLR